MAGLRENVRDRSHEMAVGLAKLGVVHEYFEGQSGRCEGQENKYQKCPHF